MDSSNRNRSSLRARRPASLAAESLEGRQLLSMGGVNFGMGQSGGVTGLPIPAMMSGGTAQSPTQLDDGPQGGVGWISNGLEYADHGGLDWDMTFGPSGGSTSAPADATTQATPSTTTTTAASGATTQAVPTSPSGQSGGRGGFGMMGRFGGMASGSTVTPATTQAGTATAVGTATATALPGGPGMGGFGARHGAMAGRFGGMGGGLGGGFGPGSGLTTTSATNGGAPGQAASGTTTASPVATAFQQYQADVKTIYDKSQVSPALESALGNDLQTLSKAATTAPDQAKVLALQSDLQTLAGTVPTSDQLATLQADFTAAVASEGVTDTATVTQTFADLNALIAATNITTTDVATLTADLKAAGLSTTNPVAPPLGVDLDVLDLALNPRAGITTTTTASPMVPATTTSTSTTTASTSTSSSSS